MIASRPLRAGDGVAVVGCSGPYDLDDLAQGVAWLRERYTVRDDARWGAVEGYFAGDDDTRTAALLDAVRDPDVRAIWAARGGYGATRVMELAGEALRDALTRDPKPLVGFSDVTALHALWQRAGVRSVHGPMVSALGRRLRDGGDVATHDAVCALLAGARGAPWSGLTVWSWPGDEATVRGRVVGGNLALLAALVGTPWAMPLDGAIVVLEDVNEAPYRVDRMLTSMRLAGAWRSVRAVVLGEFTGAAPGRDGVTVEAVLRERLTSLGVPVLGGAPYGHGERVGPWVHGAEAMLRRDGTLTFAEGL